MARKGRKGRKRAYRGKKSKKGGRSHKYKYGVAETLGVAKTALDVASNPSVGTAVKSTLTSPSLASVKGTAVVLWTVTKMNATPAITGIVISNADKLPIIGPMLRGPKHKVDRVFKKYIKMPL